MDKFIEKKKSWKMSSSMNTVQPPLIPYLNAGWGKDCGCMNAAAAAAWWYAEYAGSSPGGNAGPICERMSSPGR